MGTKFKGSIVRVEAEPYDFTIQDTGEVIKLAHRWDYVPEEGVANTKVNMVSQSELA